MEWPQNERDWVDATQRLRPILMKQLLRAGIDTSVAEEIIQDTFLKIWQRRDILSSTHRSSECAPFDSYVRVALRNTMWKYLRHLRSERRHASDIEYDLENSEHAPNSETSYFKNTAVNYQEDLILSMIQKEYFSNAMSHLTQAQRQCLIHYFSSLTISGRELLVKSLNQLTPGQLKVLIHFLAGLSSEEIAWELKMQTSAVYQIIHRCREKMAAYIEDIESQQHGHSFG